MEYELNLLNIGKKVFGLMFVTAIIGIASQILSIPVIAAEEEKWTDQGNYSTDWYEQHRNDLSYTINSSKELAGLAVLNNRGESFEDKTIKLSDNLNMSGKVWIPIGTLDYEFDGTFDGNGKTISHLSTTGSGNHQGLFALNIGTI